MSFILDALRKSDARRQQSGAPGLNSPEPPQPPRRRRRRVLPWLGVSLALLAVVATAVYLLRPEWLPQDTGVAERAPESEAPADQGPKREQDAAPAERDDGAGQDEAAEPESLAQQVPARPSEEDSAPAAEDEDAGESRPRDRRQPTRASPERTVRREAPRRESVPIPAEEATEELERRIAEESSRRREAESAESRDRPEEGRSERRRQADSSGDRDSELTPTPLNEGVAEYVQSWDLPLSVRRNLPELNLSIHVFSPNEAERFVLINGERYRSGDSVGEVEIVDINRDGAVVDFRSHRFLLEPR
ncbi:general secretion pathway protein GspB [Wenzhouxiangella sp. EGI_FJ10409]|uniref:general secretion pathway protein GspB n=1 Tax=Wenzhouxiangella sp. EGI_FJ10409 TaxID=3243767 RepID=UPI0035D64C00